MPPQAPKIPRAVAANQLRCGPNPRLDLAAPGAASWVARMRWLSEADDCARTADDGDAAVASA